MSTNLNHAPDLNFCVDVDFFSNTILWFSIFDLFPCLFTVVDLAKGVDIFMWLSSSRKLAFLGPKLAQINSKSQMLLDLGHKLSHTNSRSPILLVLVFRTALSQKEPQILDPNWTNLRFFPFINCTYAKRTVLFVQLWCRRNCSLASHLIWELLFPLLNVEWRIGSQPQ